MASTSSTPPSAAGAASPRFSSYGDSYHFRIDDHHDLKAVLELDEALWIATTAPCSTIRTDETFLELLDGDRDGRLRAEEIKDGIRFLFANLIEYAGIRPDNDTLVLAHISPETEAGRRIRSSAEKVLKRLDAPVETIGLEQVRQIKQEVLHGGLDQAGIVLKEAAGEERIGVFIGDIVATVGGVEHPSGKKGVDRRSLDDFLRESSGYLDWLKQAGEIGADDVTTILPLGAQTADAYELFRSVSEKLHQYFLLCDIKRINPELLERTLNNPETSPAANLIQIESAQSYLAGAPLSMPNDSGVLKLSSGINPYFKNMIDDFATRVVGTLLGSDLESLDRSGFSRLQELFEPYRGWIDRKPEVHVGGIDASLLQAYVTDPIYRETLEMLIRQSHETALVLENIVELERLILYQANLLPLVNSFVSFPNLYDPAQRALFEEGTLIMDGRHFTMAVKVADRKHHIEMSSNSNIFVIYCELLGKGGEVMHEIAVPVTSGSRGNLHLHKWGIFNDIDGNELHARVVDIVENPISVLEAVTAPFIRMKQAISTRIEEFSSKAEERLFHRRDEGKKKEGGTPLLGVGGVALAALGSSLAFITKTIAAMSAGTVVIALLVIGAVLIIPTAVSAYLKLSRRDLSMILEGSGWGLNSRMKLNRAQANTFTYKPNRRPISSNP